MSDIIQEGLDQSGGYLAPTENMMRLLMKEPAPTRVSGLVTTVPTSRDSLSVPRVVYATDDIYTTGIRATAVGEIPASASAHLATDPVFGQFMIPVQTWMLSSRVTNDMLEDSFFPLMPWLEERYDETIDLLKDNQIINGSGVNAQPRGILINPGGTDEPAVISIGATSAITPDGLKSLKFAPPEQYMMNLRWLMNYNTTAQAIDKLKDSENRYIWSQGLQDNGIANPMSTSLLGFPPTFSVFMPNPGSNTYPVIFGDFRAYWLVMRVGLSIQVLNEVYAETNQKAILGRLRFGGRVTEAYRVKIGQTPA